MVSEAILEFTPDFTPAGNGTETTFAPGLTNAPRGIAFDGAGNLFVAELGSTTAGGDIREFTPGGTEVLPTFASGIGSGRVNHGAEFLAFQPQHAIPGNLLASVNVGGTYQPGGSAVFQYSPTGIQSTFVSNLNAPRGVAFDNAGNLFVVVNMTVDSSGNSVPVQGTIFKIPPGGMMSTFATGFPSHFFLSGLAIDSAGNLFVVGGDDNNQNLPSTIYKITPGGTVSPFGSMPGAGRGLAFDSSGNLYAADNVDQTIYKFTPDGTQSIFADRAAFPSNDGPAGLAFDRFGSLFVSTEGTVGSVEAILEFTSDFTPAGNGKETTFASGLTNAPRGIAFDGAGNLFVAELGGTTAGGDIREFYPGGTEVLPTFASGIGSGRVNHGAEFLVFAPGETPAGSNVTVSTGTVGSAVITLTFPQVTAGGTTTVKPIDLSSAGTLPPGYDATNALAFDITTTATVTASTTSPVIIAFQVPPSYDVTILHIFHNEGGSLVDVTASNPAPNQTTHAIYASVTTLSPFVIAKLVCTLPVIQSVTASPNSIWPPNHKFVPVTVTVHATATCGIASTKIISVTSNESGSGQYKITGDLTVNLQADGNGSNKAGRIYTITVQCKDPSGNASTKTVTVTVPHDQGH